MMVLRRRDGMLIVIAAVLMTACAGSQQSPEDEARIAFADVRMAIQTVVSDPRRAAQAIALVDEMEQNFREAAANVDERRAAFHELSSNYDIPQTELKEALTKERNIMRANREKLIDTRRRLAETLTDDEWKDLEKQRSKALERAVAAAIS